MVYRKTEKRCTGRQRSGVQEDRGKVKWETKVNLGKGTVRQQSGGQKDNRVGDRKTTESGTGRQDYQTGRQQIR